MAKIIEIQNAINKLKNLTVKSANGTYNVAEQRKCKEDLINSVPKFVSDACSGRIIRDDDCLILSAPKIIIGNVDKNGHLLNTTAEIVLRGNTLKFEATGNPEGIGGSIESRAASIRQVAVDPGCDGTENVVCKNCSEIVSQAHNVNIYGSEDFGGIFIATPSTNNLGISARQDENAQQLNGKPSCGVTIHSDLGMNIEAAPSFYEISEKKEAMLQSLSKEINRLETEKLRQHDTLTALLNEVNAIFTADADFDKSDDSVRTKTYDLDTLNYRLDMIAPILNNALNTYFTTCSQLVRNSMMQQQLESIDFVKKAEDFLAKSNNSNIRMFSESVLIKSCDGDGNLCTTPTANVSIQSVRNEIISPLKGSTTIASPTITLDTCQKNFKESDKELVLEADYADGHINMFTNDLAMSAPCTQYDDGKPASKGISPSSSVSMAFANTSIEAVNAADKECKPVDANLGKAFGNVRINAQNVTIGAFDYNKEEKVMGLSENGLVAVGSKQVDIGALSQVIAEDCEAKLVQSENVGIHASGQVVSYISPEGKPYDVKTPGVILIPDSASMVHDEQHGILANDKQTVMFASEKYVMLDSKSANVNLPLNVSERLSVNGDIGISGDLSFKKLAANSPAVVDSFESCPKVSLAKK